MKIIREILIVFTYTIKSLKYLETDIRLEKHHIKSNGLWAYVIYSTEFGIDIKELERNF